MASAAAATTRRGVTRAVIAGALLLAAVGAIPFFVATTFVGDDHLFLAFSRYAPNPLAAFVRDQHGGEFYRPLPMLVWWVLGRATGGAQWPFALLMFALHVTVAVEVGALLRAIGGNLRAACIAALLFFVAPAVREAAYWYSASTDLLATALGLGAVLAVLRGRAWTGSLLFAAACWSKETAIVVPLLAALCLRARTPRSNWRAMSRGMAPLGVVALAFIGARTWVLGGVGGSGDAAASVAGKLLQIGGGLIHAGVGSDLLTEPLGWITGLAMWLALAAGSVAAARSGKGLTVIWAPWVWAALAVLPLLAAPWIVGARYFYLPSIGMAWLAGQLLDRVSPVATVGVCATLAGLTFAQATARRGDIMSYEARLGAARRAVSAGVAEGHTTFHVVSGIKDLDLAVKAAPRASVDESSLLVLGDVPASFVVLPERRTAELDFLLARPPLPPSGAYRFGSRRIVGLARRGDDPTIDEVIARLPGIRFIRLRSAGGDRVVWRDVTETWRSSDTDVDDGTEADSD